MKIVPRDIALLQWINGFGFVTTPQVASWMNTSYETARQRLLKLLKQQLLMKTYMFRNDPGLLRITKSAQHLSGDPLPPPKRIRLESYHHDLKIVDLALHLSNTYKGSFFIPERRLRFESKIRKNVRFADGELYLNGSQRPIAIELELTLKSTPRLRRILRTYYANLRYEQVWYYTTPVIAKNLRQSGADERFCKIIEWENLS